MFTAHSNVWRTCKVPMFCTFMETLEVYRFWNSVSHRVFAGVQCFDGWKVA
ncbi:hypothetical protein Plhal304r1_c013g0049641 [Plasmopara halstedii]